MTHHPPACTARSSFRDNRTWNMALLTFRKDEILRKKKLTSRLFTEGSSFTVYPYRVFWLLTPLDAEIPAQVMFSVGKRAFKHATDRNLVRRRTREAYRLQKSEFYRFLAEKDQQCALAIVYTSNKPVNSADATKKIITIFTRLYFEINKKLQSKPLIS